MGLKGYRLWAMVNLIQPAEPHRAVASIGSGIPRALLMHFPPLRRHAHPRCSAAGLHLKGEF
jgi:hypothetical protein